MAAVERRWNGATRCGFTCTRRKLFLRMSNRRFVMHGNMCMLMLRLRFDVVPELPELSEAGTGFRLSLQFVSAVRFYLANPGWSSHNQKRYLCRHGQKYEASCDISSNCIEIRLQTFIISFTVKQGNPDLSYIINRSIHGYLGSH